MGNLFKPTKERVKFTAVPQTPEAQKARGVLSGLLERPFQPFTGQRVAPLTEAEQAGQGALQEFIGRDQPELFGAAESQLLQTLRGEFDPLTSPFFEPTRRAIGQQTEEAVRGVRRGAELGGTLFGTRRPELEAEERRRGAGDLSMILAGLTEAERGRQFAAVPQAIDVGRFIEEAPLRTTAAAQQFGGLERTLTQSQLDADYQEFLRKTGFPQELGWLAQILYGMEPQRVPAEQFGPSPFSQLAGPAATVASAFI